MSTLIWTLLGFSLGSLIFSILFRREKIKTVVISLTVIWGITFFVKFIVYMNSVTPAAPPELSVLGGITVLLLFISELFKKGENNK